MTEQKPATDNKTTSHVTIACKIGVAWLDLQLAEERMVSENTQTGPRDVIQWRKVGPVVRIRGTAYPRGQAPEGYPAPAEMVLGYALTRGVDRAFWAEWLKQNAKSPFVASGMIVAFASDADIRAAARDRADELSGLEPVLRDKKGVIDKRVPRSTNKNVGEIEPSIRAA